MAEQHSLSLELLEFGDEHLEILGQITEAVSEEEILEELKKTTDVDYILNTFTN